MEDCTIEPNINKKGVSEKMESVEDKKSLELPVWRVNQIVLAAVRFLSETGYWKEGFDYKQAVRSKGIIIKGYSNFKEANLAELQKVSLGLWKDGLCLVCRDKESGKICRMIAYNDNKSDAEVMQIIFHEYGHIEFRHTEQSIHGETEAYLFSAVVMLLLVAEKEFHVGRLIATRMGETAFYQGMRRRLMTGPNKKEVA